MLDIVTKANKNKLIQICFSLELSFFLNNRSGVMAVSFLVIHCYFVGARTVIHPKVRIIAEAGPVIIGEYNIIEELVHITNQLVHSFYNLCQVL